MSSRQRMPCRTDCAGAVLIDVLTSMTFVVLVIGMAQTWARATLITQRVLEVTTATDQDAALALTIMAREIRDAGGGVAPLAAAGAEVLEVAADLNNDGDTSDSFERVRYAYRADRLQVTRASGAGNAQPFVDNVPPGGLRLSYWTADGREIAAQSTLSSTDRAQVHRIDVRLRTETPHPDARARMPIVVDIATSIALRNR